MSPGQLVAEKTLERALYSSHVIASGADKRLYTKSRTGIKRDHYEVVRGIEKPEG